MPIIFPSNDGVGGQSFFSVANTTIGFPLGANEQFVGEWEDVSVYPSISVLCNVNQFGTLYFDFSIDQVVLDRSFAVPIIQINTGTYVATGPMGRYFRIRYINGPISQTVFRLQSTYGSVVESSHTQLGSGIEPLSNAAASRSLMYGAVNSNTYTPIKVDSSGAIALASISPSSTTTTLTPIFVNNKLQTMTTSLDQEIVSYTTMQPFNLMGFNVSVSDVLASYSVVFGECSLESPPGNKLYTSQLTSMAGGKDFCQLSSPLVFPANQTLRIVCSPSAPINNQVWRGNLIGGLTTSTIVLPIFINNKLETTILDADQVVISYTTTQPFNLMGFSMFVWDIMTSYSVVFGEYSLESPPGNKLYTSQLTSVEGGKDFFQFSSPLAFPANQTIRLVCSPSEPINSQTWQGNLIGSV